MTVAPARPFSTVDRRIGGLETIVRILGIGTEEDSVDAKFYRKYKKLDSETRRKIRDIAKLIGKE